METRRPFGYVTKSGAFVTADVLDMFSIKQTSQRIKTAEFKGLRGLVTPLFNPESLARHLEANTYHARCVRTKAQDVAGMGWQLHPLSDEPSEDQKTTAKTFFDELTDDIGDTLTRAMIDREAIGYMALELVRENKEPSGKPIDLFHIPAHTMRACDDEKRFVQQRGVKRVWFKKAGLTDIDVDKKTGKIHEANQVKEENRANEVIWDVIYTPRSDIYGVPDHIPAVGAILGDVARCDYNIAFFQNHGVPAYAVCVTGDFDPGIPVDSEGREEGAEGAAEPFKPPLQWTIEEYVKELAANPHSVITLIVPSATPGEKSVEIKFEPIATEVKDASFRLYRKDNRDEIFSAHAVPPYRAGIAETGSLGGTTAKETDEIYRDSVIRPRQQRLEALINKEVLEWLEVTDWAFDLLDLDLSDVEREIDMALKLFDNGALTPNDLIRNFGENLGLKPIEDIPAMDAHYVKGKPVDMGLDLGPDIEAVLEDTQKRLIEVVVKNVSSDADGARVSEVLEAITGLKANSS